MGLTDQDWKDLTESKYFTPQEGKQYRVVLERWHRIDRTFRVEGSDRVDVRAALEMNVVAIDGEGVRDKTFVTSNREVVLQLQAAILLAENQGRTWIKVFLHRVSRTKYTVVDLELVNMASDKVRS